MNRPAPAWTAAVALATGYWVAVALAGGDGSPVDTAAGGAAAAAATAALVGAGWGPRSPAGTWPSALVLALLPVAVAGGPRLLALMFGTVAVAGVAVIAGAVSGGRARKRGTGGTARLAELVEATGGGNGAGGNGDRGEAVPARGRRRRSWPRAGRLPDRALPLLAAAAGSALLTAALLAERAASAGWVVPGRDGAALGLAVLGAGAVVLGTATGPPAGHALAPPALAVALGAGAHLSAAPATLALSGVAVAAALRLGRRPALALAALGMAAAVSVPTAPAGALLGAAAAFAVVVGHPVAAVLGIPGAASLAAVVLPPGRSASGAILAVATVAVALLLAHAARRPTARPPTTRPPLEAGPALVLGAWLLLVPGTWRWAGPVGLEAYDRGVAVAVAAGALGYALVRLTETVPGLASAWPAGRAGARSRRGPAHRSRSGPRHRARSRLRWERPRRPARLPGAGAAAPPAPPVDEAPTVTETGEADPGGPPVPPPGGAGPVVVPPAADRRGREPAR